MRVSKCIFQSKSRILVNSIPVYLLFFVFLAPFIYLIMSSLKTSIEVQAYPPVFRFNPTPANYIRVLREINLIPFFVNSIIVATVTTAFCILLAFPAAYSLARFRFKMREGIAYAFFASQMVPFIALIFPLFIIANKLGLYDNVWVLIMFYLPWNTPFAIWMLRSFIGSVPVELEEAAMVDGSSRLNAFLRITIPLLLPGLLTTVIFTFIGAWNEFVLAFFLTSVSARTFPTTVDFFLTYGRFEWGALFASAVIGTAPIAIFAVLVKKYYLTAMTGGALKY